MPSRKRTTVGCQTSKKESLSQKREIKRIQRALRDINNLLSGLNICWTASQEANLPLQHQLTKRLPIVRLSSEEKRIVDRTLTQEMLRRRAIVRLTNEDRRAVDTWGDVDEPMPSQHLMPPPPPPARIGVIAP